MKNMRKNLIILTVIFVMFLSSCAPSPMVHVVSRNSKTIEQSKQNSSKKDLSKKQNVNRKTSYSITNNRKISSGNSVIAGKDKAGKSGNSNNERGSVRVFSQSGRNVGYGSGNGGDSGNEADGSSENGNTTGSGSQGENTGGHGSENKTDPGGGTGYTTAYYSYDQTTLNIPKDVQNVAAAGIYADMVKMLGGNLVATSEDNMNNSLFKAVFNVTTSNVKSFMPVSGQNMTRSDAEKLASMSGDMKPQAVVADSSTFSGSEGEAAKIILNNSNIKIFQSQDNISDDVAEDSFNEEPFVMVLHNVYYMGQMLKDKCEGSDKIAQNFEDYYKKNVNGKSGSLHDKFKYNKNTDIVTQYVDGFRINAASNGNNIPSSIEEYQNNLDFAKSHYDWTKQAMSTDDGRGAKPEGVSDSDWAKYMKSMEIPGQYNYYGTVYRFGLENNFFSSALQMVDVQNLYENHSNPFPMYQEQKERYEKFSPGYSPSGQQIDDVVAGTKYDPNGNLVKLMDFKVTGSGSFHYYYPNGKYINLYVQPYGIHSWTSGSPESLIEPMWLASIFQSGSDINIRQTVKDFYSQFYHKNNLSSDQLDQILGTE